MQSLRSGNFTLPYQATVNVKVKAYNERGWSDYSALVAGPAIQTEPLRMSAPIEGSLTNTKRVQITWTAPNALNTGGSPVTSYNLYWDQGYGSWRSVVGEFS